MMDEYDYVEEARDVVAEARERLARFDHLNASGGRDAPTALLNVVGDIHRDSIGTERVLLAALDAANARIAELETKGDAQVFVPHQPDPPDTPAATHDIPF